MARVFGGGGSHGGAYWHVPLLLLSQTGKGGSEDLDVHLGIPCLVNGEVGPGIPGSWSFGELLGGACGQIMMHFVQYI